ncbi:MAG: hypothetical protein J6Y78_09240 [Paludibacteraceae bacterium]|nr:hypothetical protein [Paludibacteraceae bacterium]
MLNNIIEWDDRKIDVSDIKDYILIADSYKDLIIISKTTFERIVIAQVKEGNCKLYTVRKNHDLIVSMNENEMDLFLSQIVK